MHRHKAGASRTYQNGNDRSGVSIAQSVPGNLRAGQLSPKRGPAPNRRPPHRSSHNHLPIVDRLAEPSQVSPGRNLGKEIGLGLAAKQPEAGAKVLGIRTV